MAVKTPIAEPGSEPLGLEAFYDAEPERWSEEVLRAAVEAQRRERDVRFAALARKKTKKPVEVRRVGSAKGEGDAQSEV